jgi:hypothetical protein
MKHVFLIAAAALVLSACQQSSTTAGSIDSINLSEPAVNTKVDTTSSTPMSADAAVLTFENMSHDFGKIAAGEKVQYDFYFTNTGKTPLIITGATATCGCTVPETPKEPIQPGEKGVIKVVFDSTGKTGLQDKVITVTSNGNPSSVEVHLKGEVTT